MAKDLNLEDIARLSGFSRSTVSRVINNEAYVSASTREKVFSVIQEHGYQPNIAARVLASQRSKVIGVLIPHTVNHLFIDPFFSILLDSITAFSNERGYGVTLWLASANSTPDNFYARGFINSIIDGLLIASATISEEFSVWLNTFPKPYVFVGSPIPPTEKISYVEVENTRGAYLATSHLIEQGYRRIGHIEGRQGQISSQDRKAGYLAALADHAIPIDNSIIVPGNYTEVGGYEAMKTLLNHPLDAIFASSDLTAIGAIRAIREAGLSVPNQIAVAGFDDVPSATTSTPPLTTIRQPINLLGEQAAHTLISLLDGQPDDIYQMLLPVELIVRESTCRIVE